MSGQNPSRPTSHPSDQTGTSTSMSEASPPSSKAGEDDTIELASMLATDPRLPIEQDIMQLARVGEVDNMKKLFDAGKFEPTYQDEEGITPLHVRSPFSMTLELLWTNLQYIGVVGGDQQSLCHVQVSDRTRS